MIKPQLAKDCGVKPPVVPTGDQWVMEPKFNGWRFMFERTASGIVAWGGRNGKPHSGEADEIEEVLYDLPIGTILDGELLALLPNGQEDSVSSYLAKTPRGRQLTGRYCVFDVLSVGETEAMRFPWTDRRELLEGLHAELGPQEPVQLVPYAATDQALFERWVDLGMEGAVCKRKSSLYRPGSRTWDWTKCKPQDSTEAEVIGFEMGKGAGNTHLVGALKIRLIETGGETSTGYECTPDEAAAMVGKMCEIRHNGWFDEKVQHPVFYRWRPDRDVEGAAA